MSDTLRPEEEQKPKFHVVDRRHWAESENDDHEPGSGEPRKPAYVQELEAKLEEAERTVTTIRVQHREAQSEFENAKARLRGELQKEVTAYKRSFLADLLEVVDSLDRGLEAADKTNDVTTLRQGLELVREQFLAKLAANGIERVECQGQPFDPHWHEAISTIPVSDPDGDQKVLGTVRSAYKMGDEVLRTALVAVGQHTPE